MNYKARKLSGKVLFSLKQNPVVFLNGPRQSGKTTLVRELARNEYPAEYVSFDNVTHMEAAYASPESFLGRRGGPVIIDEVQLVPDLFRALKIVVDEARLGEGRSNGMFLLTGSANIMVLPKLSDSLVGRMSVRTLYPFSACEVFSAEGNFPERLFSADFADMGKEYALSEAIESATFPEVSGKPAHEREEWFDGYLATILQRDVRTITELEKIGILPRLLRVLAARAGKLMNDAEIARDVGLNQVTGKSYRGILQAMFLSFDVRPWYRNVGKRLVKSSKGYIVDTLLLCHLLGRSLEGPSGRWSDFYGHAVENFVASELRKLLSFSDMRAELFHFRTADGKEVDFVLERPDGSVAGIEVKASKRVVSSDFKGMEALRDLAKDDFVCGVVLYPGEDVVPFGERFLAVPLSALWQ
ncbi:MAG: ATP-binding protein [Candidatus Dadabacteria bacterium]|nr:ATP-binding protein [Candidatus Dadabacteria bacterium]MDE0520033.1 ATP-binding protein [Candidatus Dadabacteria bacterium]MDE0663862.1 ATP-binding protein [Candidatus Dadabacteria bacterium]